MGYTLMHCEEYRGLRVGRKVTFVILAFVCLHDVGRTNGESWNQFRDELEMCLGESLVFRILIPGAIVNMTIDDPCRELELLTESYPCTLRALRSLPGWEDNMQVYVSGMNTLQLRTKAALTRKCTEFKNDAVVDGTPKDPCGQLDLLRQEFPCNSRTGCDDKTSVFPLILHSLKAKTEVRMDRDCYAYNRKMLAGIFARDVTRSCITGCQVEPNAVVPCPRLEEIVPFDKLAENGSEFRCGVLEEKLYSATQSFMDEQNLLLLQVLHACWLLSAHDQQCPEIDKLDERLYGIEKGAHVTLWITRFGKEEEEEDDDERGSKELTAFLEKANTQKDEMEDEERRQKQEDDYATTGALEELATGRTGNDDAVTYISTELSTSHGHRLRSEPSVMSATAVLLYTVGLLQESKLDRLCD